MRLEDSAEPQRADPILDLGGEQRHRRRRPELVIPDDDVKAPVHGRHGKTIIGPNRPCLGSVPPGGGGTDAIQLAPSASPYLLCLSPWTSRTPVCIHALLMGGPIQRVGCSLPSRVRFARHVVPPLTLVVGLVVADAPDPRLIVEASSC